MEKKAEGEKKVLRDAAQRAEDENKVLEDRLKEERLNVAESEVALKKVLERLNKQDELVTLLEKNLSDVTRKFEETSGIGKLKD